jgi:hypothetical protein
MTFGFGVFISRSFCPVKGHWRNGHSLIPCIEEFFYDF